jgi:hypothetical protein
MATLRMRSGIRASFRLEKRAARRNTSVGSIAVRQRGTDEENGGKLMQTPNGVAAAILMQTLIADHPQVHAEIRQDQPDPKPLAQVLVPHYKAMNGGRNQIAIRLRGERNPTCHEIRKSARIAAACGKSVPFTQCVAHYGR